VPTDDEIEDALGIDGNTVRPTRGGLVEDGLHHQTQARLAKTNTETSASYGDVQIRGCCYE
jgi:hypothetical protein